MLHVQSIKKELFGSLNKKKKHRGISPIIATLLILGLVTTGVVIGLLQILPFVERSRIESGITSTQTGLIELDGSIQELILGGGGFKNVLIDKPLGLLDLDPTRDKYHFQISINNGTIFLPTSISSGIIEFNTPSSFDIIPVGSNKYLNGPDSGSFSDRKDIVLIDQNNQQDSGYNGMNIINMTRDPSTIGINFYYRPKIVVSQTGPNIDIQIRLVKLNTSDGTTRLATENKNNQIGLRYSINSIVPSTLNGILSANDILSIDYQNTGSDSQPSLNWNSLWTSIQNPSTGTINVRIIIYEIFIESNV